MLLATTKVPRMQTQVFFVRIIYELLFPNSSPKNLGAAYTRENTVCTIEIITESNYCVQFVFLSLLTVTAIKKGKHRLKSVETVGPTQLNFTRESDTDRNEKQINFVALSWLHRVQLWHGTN
jgi:hypothetical protein